MSRNTFNASCLPMAFAVAVNALKILLVAGRQIADAASRTHKSVAGSMVETALGGRTEKSKRYLLFVLWFESSGGKDHRFILPSPWDTL